MCDFLIVLVSSRMLMLFFWFLLLRYLLLMSVTGVYVINGCIFCIVQYWFQYKFWSMSDAAWLLACDGNCCKIPEVIVYIVVQKMLLYYFLSNLVENELVLITLGVWNFLMYLPTTPENITALIRCRMTNIGGSGGPLWVTRLQWPVSNMRRVPLNCHRRRGYRFAAICVILVKIGSYLSYWRF